MENARLFVKTWMLAGFGAMLPNASIEVRSESWLDMLLVNLSSDAPPLADFLAPLIDGLAGYNLSTLHYADQFTVFHVVPLSAGHSREELHFYLIGDAATAEEHADARQQVYDTWHDLNLEDVGILERLQRGPRAPGYQGGAFSPYWDEAPLGFARLVAEALVGG